MRAARQRGRREKAKLEKALESSSCHDRELLGRILLILELDFSFPVNTSSFASLYLSLFRNETQSNFTHQKVFAV
ncbi:hypothetical protein L3X38_039206 [Prunus dulcis]|uniref:Uncharacterized protein n=1 Tax=Prunus dulcis TaxID=3755 RepID=A0AAD4V7S7_PRUDU|nr:hypothetical protein L3X38_039206 [Prunus dulcis]